VPVEDIGNIKELASGGDFDIADTLITRIQKQIRSVMMSDQLSPLDKPGMTATEAQIRTQLIRQILGPIYGRLQSEFLNPLLQRLYGLAYRAGLLGQLPPELSSVKFAPEYKSPLSRAQKQEELTNMDQYEMSLAATSKIKPEVLDWYDWDAAALYRSEVAGVPVNLIKSPDQVGKMRAARAQAAQQAQQQQAAMMMAQKAGPQMGQMLEKMAA